MTVFSFLRSAEDPAVSFPVIMWKKLSSRRNNHSRTVFFALILCAVIGGLFTAAVPAHAETYTVEISIDGDDLGKVLGPTREEFSSGSWEAGTKNLTFEAKPNAGNVFESWQNEDGEIESINATFTISELDRDWILTAVFDENGSDIHEIEPQNETHRAVVERPEDATGMYMIEEDGSKTYLMFQTYDICMFFLGRDDLCAGHEKCYHK